MQKINFHIIRLYWLILLVPAYLFSLSTSVLAQSPQPANQNQGTSTTIPIDFSNKEKKEENADGSDRGRPKKRGGMGSRDNCPATETPLTALIPKEGVGKVVEANPTFWVFIPYPANQVSKSEFVLQDEWHNDVHRENITLTKGEGIVSIPLASEIKLEPNKDYQWYFKVYCDRDHLSSPIYVRGWVNRVPPQVAREKQLNTATSPLQRLNFYAENKIWYSFLNELAKLRQQNPQDNRWAKYWLQLLNSEDLQHLRDRPIIGNIN